MWGAGWIGRYVHLATDDAAQVAPDPAATCMLETAAARKPSLPRSCARPWWRACGAQGVFTPPEPRGGLGVLYSKVGAKATLDSPDYGVSFSRWDFANPNTTSCP